MTAVIHSLASVETQAFHTSDAIHYALVKIPSLCSRLLRKTSLDLCIQNSNVSAVTCLTCSYDTGVMTN